MSAFAGAGSFHPVQDSPHIASPMPSSVASRLSDSSCLVKGRTNDSRDFFGRQGRTLYCPLALSRDRP